MTHDHKPGTAADTGAAAEWDERYSSADRLWTSNTNPALIAEASDLTPGSALDVGSGEGADARWLASRGWQVSAVDISQVAIDRASIIEPTDAITWQRVDLATDDVPGADFDLVSLQYFPIGRDDRATVTKLLDAVGSGGHLLVVAHAPEGIRAHGRDPDAYYQPRDIAADLEAHPDSWRIVTHETRPRGIAAGGGHHVDDVVLHAVRR